LEQAATSELIGQGRRLALLIASGSAQPLAQMRKDSPDLFAQMAALVAYYAEHARAMATVAERAVAAFDAASGANLPA
jgi:hypothetical protein